LSKVKKFLVAYIAFGLGTCFGAVIATFVTFSVMAAASGSPDAASILKITDCLESRSSE
jgi:hypothetical protein